MGSVSHWVMSCGVWLYTIARARSLHFERSNEALKWCKRLKERDILGPAWVSTYSHIQQSSQKRLQQHSTGAHARKHYNTDTHNYRHTNTDTQLQTHITHTSHTHVQTHVGHSHIHRKNARHAQNTVHATQKTEDTRKQTQINTHTLETKYDSATAWTMSPLHTTQSPAISHFDVYTILGTVRYSSVAYVKAHLVRITGSTCYLRDFIKAASSANAAKSKSDVLRSTLMAAKQLSKRKKHNTNRVTHIHTMQNNKQSKEKH